jgi:D-amino-acid dehydrogenase
MVTWDDGRIVVGATRETGSGFTLGTSASGIREVLDEALRVAPGLAEAELLEVRVGLRPYTTDILPVLGAVPNIGNIYLATGHGPTGLQLGPYSGKVVADMIAGRPISDDLEPFHISRFTQE